MRHEYAPDTQSHDLFENQVTFTDLLESTVPNSEQRGMQTPSLDFCDWVVAGDQDAKSLADLDLQRSLIDEVEYSQWAKFKIKAEIVVEDYFTDYETLIQMNADARLASGNMSSIQTKPIVPWLKECGGAELEANSCRIYGWHTESFYIIDAEILDTAIIDLADLDRARVSIPYNIVTNAILDLESFVPPNKFFSIGIMNPIASR